MGKKTFGQLFKELRLANGYTLRGFCRLLGKDPSNISKIERGVSPPLQDQGELKKYAVAFRLDPDSEEYREFFDLAAIGAGRIPPAILADEEILSRLPVFCRTVLGQKLDPEKLDKLIDLIRKG